MSFQFSRTHLVSGSSEEKENPTSLTSANKSMLSVLEAADETNTSNSLAQLKKKQTSSLFFPSVKETLPKISHLWVNVSLWCVKWSWHICLCFRDLTCVDQKHTYKSNHLPLGGDGTGPIRAIIRCDKAYAETLHSCNTEEGNKKKGW